MDHYRPTFSVATSLLEAAATKFELTPWDVTKTGKTRRHYIPRFAMIWVLRQLGQNYPPQLNPYSYKRIANMLSYEDHTSVMYGYREAEKYRDKWPEFRRITDELLELAQSQEPKVLSKAA